MITIFVGDVTDECAIEAHSVSNRAMLISTVEDLRSGVYYTSLGDLENTKNFITVLAQADELVYVPPLRWSDVDRYGHSDMKSWTEFYLRFFNDKKKVVAPIALSWELPGIDLVDTRRSSSKQIWIAGCSISHGVGVDTSERYGQLLADHLGLPVSFLTRGSASNEWVSNQVLRSDIQAGDTVVFGVTNELRFPYYADKKVNHVNPRYYELNKNFKNTISVSYLEGEPAYYRTVSRLLEVVNFCHKVQASLYFAGILVGPALIPYVMSMPNYIQLYGNFGVDNSDLFIDVGTDNQHPGPITHRWYADKILERIKGKS